MVGEVVDVQGPVDLLVNNAGFFTFCPTKRPRWRVCEFLQVHALQAITQRKTRSLQRSLFSQTQSDQRLQQLGRTVQRTGEDGHYYGPYRQRE